MINNQWHHIAWHRKLISFIFWPVPGVRRCPAGAPQIPWSVPGLCRSWPTEYSNCLTSCFCQLTVKGRYLYGGVKRRYLYGGVKRRYLYGGVKRRYLYGSVKRRYLYGSLKPMRVLRQIVLPKPCNRWRDIAWHRKSHYMHVIIYSQHSCEDTELSSL